MVLFLHNRYRTTGGEERVVEDLLGLVREQLGEDAELLERDSATLPARRRGGRAAARRARSPRRSRARCGARGARVVHAHNLNPTLGWRALAAAREAGARVVLHLHQYRLVCAVGVCFTRGAECTRCHGRDTLPGVRLNCRGSLAEAVAYGAVAGAVAAPPGGAGRRGDRAERVRARAAARARRAAAWERVHVLAPAGARASRASRGRSPARYALVVSRLAPEKGVDVAIDACRIAGMPLVVAGDGPERALCEARAARRRDVRFVGHVDDARLAALRAGAAVALVPSRSAETFGLAAAEAMAAGLPVAASRVGALPELLEEPEPGPGRRRARAGRGDRAPGGRMRGAGARGRERVRALCALRTTW